MMTENPIKFFGAALDALDTPASVDPKRANIEANIQGIDHVDSPKDPYELFRKIMGNRIQETGNEYLGRFYIDSWLRPKPKREDLDFIQQASFYQFLKEDGFRTFSILMRDFVKAHVFPTIPGMIGVDHSLTGGVIMALSERLAPENLGVVVFDVHTDLIPLHLRRGLVDYANEKEIPETMVYQNKLPPEPDVQEAYTTGNFLLHLIDQDIILPQNLVIIGPGDNADKFNNSVDPRVSDYVRHYNLLLKKGVKIITQDQLKQSGTALVNKTVNKLKCPNLYVSLDVDVSALCGVLATRFTDLVGIEMSLILKAASQITDLIALNKFSLAGLDVMEIDVYKIGAQLSDGMKDCTEDFIRQYTSLFLDHPVKRSS